MLNHSSRTIVGDPFRDGADALAMFLQESGYEAKAVYGGRDAIALAKEWRPGSVILDLHLGDMTGFEVARGLRSEFGDEIRLLAYTGWSGEEWREQAL